MSEPKTTIPWVPLASAPEWLRRPNVQILVWCGQPVCGHFSTDAQDPERRQDGLVLDTEWPGMTAPTHIAPITAPEPPPL